MSNDERLIERWLPIAEIGEESARERRSMTALPPTYYLHVWWARRPLVASRAAVLASLLPGDADRGAFLHALGIHGDPVAVRRRLDEAKRTKPRQNLGPNPYGYRRAFTYSPSGEEWDKLRSPGPEAKVLDPTAGGGSIPFEAVRLGFAAHANDLNPVAALILKATAEWPAEHHARLLPEFQQLADEFLSRAAPKYQGVFPPEPEGTLVEGYLWARTVGCPYCGGLVPLSPNWRLAPDGTGVRLAPEVGEGPGSSGRVCSFEIVGTAAEQSAGTVARGDGACPFPDCGRVIEGSAIKAQARAGEMGEQLYAVVYKRRVPRILKSGKAGKPRWERGYRAPGAGDDDREAIAERLAEKLPEWEAYDLVPNERIPDGNKTTEPHRYGMPRWRDLFSPRQLLCHGTSVEVFRELLEADREAGRLTDARQAAYGYLALSLDKVLSYNNIMCRWHSGREVMAQIFDRHDFALKWSYAEMAPLVAGVGYDWAIGQTAKCVKELVALLRPEGPLPAQRDAPPPVSITAKPGDALDHLEDASVDAVVMDPPYYDNVMYAELSDFFYVWLKRTAGHAFPELFRRILTDKEGEAVANPARFRGEKGAKELAGREYQDRMAQIFAECRRVLKPDGILTLMFTHKATGAWDALTAGLIEAGFVITASWPIHTEAEGSLHIRDKAAASSTIFLVCRPRPEREAGEETRYWEEVEGDVTRAVGEKVQQFEAEGISGVDLYLACFGPALREFSRRWPLERGKPRRRAPQSARRRLLEEGWDAYAVTAEDALEAARREVKRFRLERLTRMKAGADLDGTTAFFVLAWDAFKAPSFPYDEALRLARAVGVDLEGDVVGRLGGKRGSLVTLWDSGQRAAKSALGAEDGSRGMIDALHHAAWRGRSRGLEDCRKWLGEMGLGEDAGFRTALKAALEVLPVSGAFGGEELEGEAAASGDDFAALEKLRRTVFETIVPEPEQLQLL